MYERAMVIAMTQFAFGNIEDMVDSVWMAHKWHRLRETQRVAVNS